MKRENELAIWIMLSTWRRAGETMETEWKNVRLQKAVSYLPAANTTTGVARLVHLSPFALRQSEELHLLTDHTPWCFQARPNGRMREGAQLQVQRGRNQGEQFGGGHRCDARQSPRMSGILDRGSIGLLTGLKGRPQ